MPKKEDLIKGALYQIKRGPYKWVKARFIKELPPSWGSNTHYQFTSLETNRLVVIKSKAKIRECPGLATPAVPVGFNQER